MNKLMTRGKSQVLYNYLPGQMFDFEKVSEIARVTSIEGTPNYEYNLELVLKSIQSYASAWKEIHRPSLVGNLSKKQDRFVLIDPHRVNSDMFPLILKCQNPNCSRVFDSGRRDEVPPTCPVCKKGKLEQLRWVKIHRCGALKPLNIPFCSSCKSSDFFALETRGSQKIRDFVWVCKKCGNKIQIYGGKCDECRWESSDAAERDPQVMDIEVFRAKSTYYPHSVVNLNVLKKDLNRFLALKEFPELAALYFLNAPEINGKSIEEFLTPETEKRNDAKVTEGEIEKLKLKGYNSKDIESYIRMRNELQSTGHESSAETSLETLALKLFEKTGVGKPIWDKIGLEMMESFVPFQKESLTKTSSEMSIIGNLGLKDVILVSDFPMMISTFGYSRVDYRPDFSRLNTFSPDKDHSGKVPIFIDTIQADAIFLRLEPSSVINWLERNGLPIKIPNGTDLEMSRAAYFVKLFDGANFGMSIKDDQSARMVFGLLHTLSHLAVRQASLMCGLEGPGLSEYILPRSLTIGIYSNHRFGATIGALTSLYEQSLESWLNEIYLDNICVYDPVCSDSGGSCHACTHLSETSCRFFNVNLSRSFLFGGKDIEFGKIRFGYFDTGEK